MQAGAESRREAPVLVTYSNLSDDELVSACIENHREAWNEFFRRFIPVIKRAIKQRLSTSGNSHLGQDQDVIWDIHKEIVINLYRKGKLRYCVDRSNVGAWLREVASNQTTDWLRKRNSRKRFPEKAAETTMISLFTPLRENPESSLCDVIADKPLEADPNLKKMVQDALQRLSDMPNVRALWVLRLTILGYLPLSEDEIDQLAQLNGRSVNDLVSHLDRIINQLEAKEHRKTKAAGKAVVLFHEIRELENLLLEMGKNPAMKSDEKTTTLRNIIHNKANQREECLKEARMICRPSNRDIAALVGVPEEKAEQVSVILIRARQMLKEALGLR